MHENDNKYVQNYKKVLNCDRSTNCLFSTGVHISNTEISFLIACSCLNDWLGEGGEAEENWNQTQSDVDLGIST